MSEERSHRSSSSSRRKSGQKRSGSSEVSSALNELRKENSLATNLTFMNDLPDIPVDPKFLELPKQEDYAYKYDLAYEPYVESAHTWELHAEPDLGVLIDLIDPSFYEAPNEQERPPLDELDQIITNDKYAQPAKEAAKTRRGQIEGQVTWLRHPSVMHTDIHDSVYKHADTKKYSANILSRRIREAEVDQTKTKQERIEDSFKAVAEPIRHPTNPNLTPVAEWEVLPDPYMWGFSNVSVTFDSNPEKEGEIDLPEAPAEGYRKDPRASAHDETDIETEPRARRMRHSVIRVPKDDERSSMEGLRGCLLVPDPEDIPSEDPESFQTFAEQDDELYLRATREYDLTVKTFRRRRRDAANRALTAEEANKRGESLEQVDEHLLFIWDSKEKVIRFAPMQSRIECAKIPTRHSNEDVFRLRRERLPDEEDEYAEAVAEIAEEDPASAKAAISRRRLDRRKHERQQREDQREASAAASSSTNLNGNASSGGHTSRNTGINSSSHSNSAASDTGMPERLAEEQLFSGDDDDEDV